jgi:hypothetical protein
LPDRVFENCGYVRIDEFGENGNLTSIGISCFEKAGSKRETIETIYIHDSITTLGTNCFRYYGSSTGPNSL